MRSNIEVVDYRKNATYRAVQAIREKTAGETWQSERIAIIPEEVTSIQLTSVSVYYADPTDLPTKRFFGLRTIQPRRRHICTIWFENLARKATPNHWFVDAYGAANLQQVESLVEQLCATQNAKATIKLVSGRPEYETFARDYLT